MILALDDRYLYKPIPGAQRLADAGDGHWPGVLVRINAAGRRGDESAMRPGARRVLVYGDSFIAAEDTDETQTFTESLERGLADRVGATAVLNAGVTGYGPDQIALRLEDEIGSVKPDVVVVALFAGNDFGDLLRNKLFRLDDAGSLAANRPTIAPELRQEFGAPLEWSPIQLVRAVQSAAQHWRARRQSPAPPPAGDRTSVRIANRHAEYDEYIVNGDSTVRNLVADEYDADVSLEPESPSARYRMRMMAAVVDRIRRTADAGGARLLLLIIPELCDVGGPCDEVVARRRFPSYRPEGLTDSLAAIARDRNVEFVNLFDAFRAAGPASLYFQRDQHWNVEGQRLAAAQVAEALVNKGWLKR